MKETARMLLQLRGFYLMTGLAGGLMNPYLTSLLVHNGLTSSQVGWVMSIGSLLIIAIQPVWGALVDRFQRTKLVLVLSLAVPALLAAGYNARGLLLLSTVYALSAVFTAAQAPIADSYAVTAARRANTSYGTIRCFQSLGNAAAGYAGGLFLAHVPITYLWIPFLAINLTAVMTVLLLPEQKSGAVVSATFREGMAELLRDRRFLLFLAGCFMVNQTLTAFNTYFVEAFQSIGGSYALAGVGLMIAALSNIPAMLLASRVIPRVGRENVLLLGAAAYIVRWGVQWLFPVPAVVLSVQVLQGLSFGFFYIAAVEYVSVVVAKHMQATGQSVFNMVFVGMAGITGNLVNGYLLNYGGAGWMTLSCTISAALGCGLLYYVARGPKLTRLQREAALEAAKPGHGVPSGS
ncbi:MFS transporter [Paenibacillus rigui]|uniref:MFS transporter n=1 Tax=Paenibacillus rigui TaxID=554312 RepID=A0A229UJY4_9BACL|nr:MFS transporter [Paenibacillus rigui]OXM83614.1 MFS transporter [Paenibacillus rigui]